MKKMFCLILTVIFCSCNYFNGNGRKDLIKKPGNIELCGSWEFDQISYNNLRFYSYECNDAKITLYKDGSFETTNFPDPSEFSSEGDKTCGTFYGKWNIDKRFSKEKWTVTLRFDESELSGTNNLLSFDIFMEGDKLILRHPFEDSEYDSDSDDRLLLRKI
jgi:hypothetical protein